METDFEAIDALLAGARQEVGLPPAEERRALREGLGLSRTQVAKALGVSASTVGGWEAGREPSGDTRERYAYFLQRAEARLTQHTPPAADAGTPPPPAPEPDHAPTDPDDDVVVLATPRPCALCGAPARHEVAGFPQHLDPSECGHGTGTGTHEPPHEPPREQPREAAEAHPRPTAPASRTPAEPKTARPMRVTATGRRAQAAEAQGSDTISRAVADALARHEGDIEAAAAALVRRAIPDAMALLDECRNGGRYDIVAYPWIPDILRKPTARGADQIWEARPKWTRPSLPQGEHQVTALDVNGAYLSALKTHLPIGQLEHTAGGGHDPRRAGVHLITPPPWLHDDVLPNPIGSRDEPGPLWVTEPTLRLLLRLSGPRYGLCDPPEIHESYTSGATENLLEKFRVALKTARDRALAEEDEVTLEYVKAMYSKFVSTMGESNYNRELYRPDWMHLIRSQAFANLWMKAFKAHSEGLLVVRAMGTDELHVTGDWRGVFAEGRGVTEVKVKDTYTVGTPEET